MATPPKTTVSTTKTTGSTSARFKDTSSQPNTDISSSINTLTRTLIGIETDLHKQRTANKLNPKAIKDLQESLDQIKKDLKTQTKDLKDAKNTFKADFKQKEIDKKDSKDSEVRALRYQENQKILNRDLRNALESAYANTNRKQVLENAKQYKNQHGILANMFKPFTKNYANITKFIPDFGLMIHAAKLDHIRKQEARAEFSNFISKYNSDFDTNSQALQYQNEVLKDAFKNADTSAIRKAQDEVERLIEEKERLQKTYDINVASHKTAIQSYKSQERSTLRLDIKSYGNKIKELQTKFDKETDPSKRIKILDEIDETRTKKNASAAKLRRLIPGFAIMLGSIELTKHAVLAGLKGIGKSLWFMGKGLFGMIIGGVGKLIKGIKNNFATFITSPAGIVSLLFIWAWFKNRILPSITEKVEAKFGSWEQLFMGADKTGTASDNFKQGGIVGYSRYMITKVLSAITDFQSLKEAILANPVIDWLLAKKQQEKAEAELELVIQKLGDTQSGQLAKLASTLKQDEHIAELSRRSIRAMIQVETLEKKLNSGKLDKWERSVVEKQLKQWKSISYEAILHDRVFTTLARDGEYAAQKILIDEKRRIDEELRRAEAVYALEMELPTKRQGGSRPISSIGLQEAQDQTKKRNKMLDDVTQLRTEQKKLKTLQSLRPGEFNTKIFQTALDNIQTILTHIDEHTTETVKAERARRGVLPPRDLPNHSDHPRSILPSNVFIEQNNTSGYSLITSPTSNIQ